MSDAQKALLTLLADVEDALGYPSRDAFAAAILGAGWTPPGERVKPSVEDVARLIGKRWNMSPRNKDVLDDARAVLALFPGRTEAEVKAEALREFEATIEGAPKKVHTLEVRGWVRDYAARIEKEADRG